MRAERVAKNGHRLAALTTLAAAKGSASTRKRGRPKKEKYDTLLSGAGDLAEVYARSALGVTSSGIGVPKKEQTRRIRALGKHRAKHRPRRHVWQLEYWACLIQHAHLLAQESNPFRAPRAALADFLYPVFREIVRCERQVQRGGAERKARRMASRKAAAIVKAVTRHYGVSVAKVVEHDPLGIT